MWLRYRKQVSLSFCVVFAYIFQVMIYIIAFTSNSALLGLFGLGAIQMLSIYCSFTWISSFNAENITCLIIKDWKSQMSWSYGFYNFAISFVMLPDLGCTSAIAYVPIQIGHPMVTFPLHFGYFSSAFWAVVDLILVSVICKM